MNGGIRIISILFLSAMVGYGNALLSAPKRQKPLYGVVIDTQPSDVPDAQLDKIVLYSQKGPDSNQIIERNALLVRHKDAVATVLICHGFMCDKFDVEFLRNLFSKSKYNTMTFDFRAHGEKAQGQCCTLGQDEKYEVIAAGRFLQNYEETKDVPIILYGFSMGAVASIMAQAEIQKQRRNHSGLFTAMILDCPFDSAENVIKRSIDNIKIPFFGYEFDVPGKSILQQYAFHPYVQSFIIFLLKSVEQAGSKNIPLNVRPIHTIQEVQYIDIPCFFIHCKNDEKVHVDAARKLFMHAGNKCESPGYKELLITEGRRHFDSFFVRPVRYKQVINDFVERALTGALVSGKSKVIEDSDNGLSDID